MEYYDEYDRDLMEYENELYKDPAEESEEESEIDSEIEDKLLSAIHYSSDLIGNNQKQSQLQSQSKLSSQNNLDTSNSSSINSISSTKNKDIIDNVDTLKNKPQKPSIINSENLIPASIYNEAKSKTISKSALSNIYNFDSDEENDNEDDDKDSKGTTRYFAPQAKKEVVCYFCRQTGHLSVDCDQKKTLCPICKENHDPLKCPYSNACLKCACIGHQSRDCPNLWQRQNCKFCYEVHNTVECPYLWRRYNVNIFASRQQSNTKINRYCYNCGLKGHFGDECGERRYNRVFKVSAQSSKN
ncbi:hypothetical protein U3516DRAFT_490748, partial [Neocallimastix sp. 'constans']